MDVDFTYLKCKYLDKAFETKLLCYWTNYCLPCLTSFSWLSPRYCVTVVGFETKLAGPGPTETHAEALQENVWASVLVFRRHCPLLSRWWIQLPWAKVCAISCDGAWQLEWTLLAQIMALKDSNASVANRMAGPKHLMCSIRCRRMWNFGLLNQRLVYCAAQQRK